MQNYSFLTKDFFIRPGLLFLLAISLLYIPGCSSTTTKPEPEPDVFQLLKVSTAERTLSSSQKVTNVSVDTEFNIEFSVPADTQAVGSSISLTDPEQDTAVTLHFSYNNGGRQISALTGHGLDWNTDYKLEIDSTLRSDEGATFPGTAYLFQTENGELHVVSATLNGKELSASEELRRISYQQTDFSFTFSSPLDGQQYQNYFDVSPAIGADYSLSDDKKTVNLSNTDALDYYRHYSVDISEQLTSANGFDFNGYKAKFQTGLDSTRKMPQLTEAELLTKIQKQTFDYFWDFGHPVSGLARERNTSDETVTTGGSGFGLMAIIVGIHRGFITRTQGVDRLRTIVDFLADADRFHGAWPHWMNGSTGEVIPFSKYDDGGDLVETAYLAQGLITVREFLDSSDATESALIDDINTLLDTIEWDWYTRDGEDVLYWHWSPDYGWKMDMPIKGYNEALIVYVMAASSTNHSIAADVYHSGWASSGGIENGGMFYGYTLPLGYDYGGPLFFAHYSFLGLDPEGLSDQYANYWRQNQNHTLINYEQSLRNPNNFIGYSSHSWGLTASDEPGGYSAHSPTHDNGTITPTAAISSMPYTPEKSKQALEHFYYILGDKLWGKYGFYDAFNPTRGWWANSYLAIDQGPIIIMIENYRSGLLWNLFMDAPEVQSGLDKLGFTTSTN